jgi:hypothetical protein
MVSIALIGCSKPDAPVETPAAQTAPAAGKATSVGTGPKPMLTQGSSVTQMGTKGGGN